MRRGFCVIGLIAGGLGLSGSAVGAETPAPEQTVAPLEVAPGDLGAVRSEGRMLLTSANKGKELVLLEVASGTLTGYLEASGSRWGDPQVLTDDHGGFEQVFNLAANGSAVALLSPRRLTVFDRDGSLVAWSSAYLLASDIEAKGSGWALALRNMPVPGPGGFAGQEALADYDPPPRVIELDPKLKLTGAGLPQEETERTAAQANARSLRLAANGSRLYAAEHANYTLYELSPSLRLRDTYRHRSLQFEGQREGTGLRPIEEYEPEELPEEARQFLASRGEELAGDGGRDGQAVMAEVFKPKTAIRDIAWDDRGGRLVLLLDPSASSSDAPPGGAGAIDLFDPVTGETERLYFALPAREGLNLSRIVVGHSALWLRGASGQHPTYRLDRSQLEEADAVPVAAPERVSAQTSPQ